MKISSIQCDDGTARNTARMIAADGYADKSAINIKRVVL
jgi:hypothetical protein